jgi:RNA polymerase sigma-70 factor (ECF subfamily)
MEMSMPEQNCRRDLEQELLPHLDAAYNLARWLTCNDQDAQDVVQEAYMRAFRFSASRRVQNVRPWLLRIVRNTCYTRLHLNRLPQPTAKFDEELFVRDPGAQNLEEALLRSDSSKLLRQALESLPAGSREVLVLRELQGMTYKEISEVTGIPCGTVMSRLSRARSSLRQTLAYLGKAGTPPGSLGIATLSA